MKEKKTMQGKYQGSGKGFGFFIPDGGAARENDYFVPPHCGGGAWDSDRVEVETGEEDPLRPGKPCVRVLRVLERGNKTVTGTIRRRGRELWLEPDGDRLPGPIRVVGRGKAREGEKAAVTMAGYGTEKAAPMGTLKAVFGPAGSRAAAVEAVLCRQDIQREFPPAVLAEAAAAPQEVPAAALADRLDLREKTVITIDGASSKDLDDAVSLERDEKGRWVLGVHIADVSSYVPSGSALDEEALRRGTSVYFADQVVPMLPVELSNGICSLNPGVDRLTLSCIMVMDKKGTVVEHTIAKSVIRSTERMTYENCNALLEGRAGAELTERYAHILPMLRDMAALSESLKKLRRLRGSLDLDTQESYIRCDPEGKPVEIVARSQGVSEGLIESFMLAANETVAKHLFDLKRPTVYRVHEKPSQEKAERLRAMLAPLGCALPQADGYALQKVLDAAKGKPEAPAVSMMILRSMMKARYDPENLGHFGLGADYYCHFTSPIRRYPDLMVHRGLHLLLDGKKTGEKKFAKDCREAADRSSQRELAAQSAEREIDKLYFAEYMQSHIGERFPAAVSGVTRFGLFAALPNGVEGFLPVETLPRDRYVYHEDRMELAGEEYRWTFGMALEVACVAAEAGTGRIEFRLPGQEEVPSHGERKSAAPKPERRSHGPSRSRRAMHVPKPRRKGKTRR